MDPPSDGKTDPILPKIIEPAEAISETIPDSFKINEILTPVVIGCSMDRGNEMADGLKRLRVACEQGYLSCWQGCCQGDRALKAGHYLSKCQGAHHRDVETGMVIRSFHCQDRRFLPGISRTMPLGG